ncbi:hypothetical protein PM082_020967 [Marasmius tenuissimus]|nr:hypothetical protein PM082_020967 [Marasmius tenuissimus]
MLTPILSISLSNAVVETLLYGIFLPLVKISISLRFMLVRQSTSSTTSTPRGYLGIIGRLVSRPVFLISATVLITHWICTIVRLFEAAVFFESDDMLASSYYRDVSRVPFVAKTAFTVLSAVLCDGIIMSANPRSLSSR